MFSRPTFTPLIGQACALTCALLLTGCQDDAQTPPTAGRASPAPNAQTAPAPAPAPAQIIRIPFSAAANDLLVDDFNGDSHPDIAFTSHDAGFTQVFLQTDGVAFTAGPPVEAVGFHPGQLIRIPAEGRRLYAMNSEGASMLRVFEPTSAGGLTQIAEAELTSPRHGAVFHWPDWDLGLAITRFGTGAIDFVKNFDPLTGKMAGVGTISYTPAAASARAIVAADLNADGIDEILFTNTISNVVYVIHAPKPGVMPTNEVLWRFQPGGRAHAVIPADIDQDGDLDLLVPDATDKRELDRTDINVLVNEGGERFTAQRIEFPTRPRSAGGMPGINAAAFQVERDGYGYLVATGYESLTLMRVSAKWSGAAPETHKVNFKSNQAITGAVLRDIDGDGWLDLVMSRAAAQNSGIVIRGPLTQAFDTLASEGAPFAW